MYDSNHSLSEDAVEIDFFINTALWLMEHNEDRTEKNPRTAATKEWTQKDAPWTIFMKHPLFDFYIIHAF